MVVNIYVKYAAGIKKSLMLLEVTEKQKYQKYFKLIAKICIYLSQLKYKTTCG